MRPDAAVTLSRILVAPQAALRATFSVDTSQADDKISNCLGPLEEFDDSFANRSQLTIRLGALAWPTGQKARGIVDGRAGTSTRG